MTRHRPYIDIFHKAKIVYRESGVEQGQGRRMSSSREFLARLRAQKQAELAKSEPLSTYTEGRTVLYSVFSNFL